MSSPNLKLIVLDCDGVLFDSLEANKIYYSTILEKVGRAPLTEEELAFVHVHSVEECFRYLAKDNDNLIQKMNEVAQSLPYHLFFQHLKPEKGLYEFLGWAKGRYRLALCTNRTTSTVPLLKHFGLLPYFDLIRTALDYPKSDPRALNSILEHFKVTPKQALYVGDSEVDQRLCEAVGVPFVGYKNPNLNCQILVKDFNDFLLLLQQRKDFSKGDARLLAKRG